MLTGEGLTVAMGAEQNGGRGGGDDFFYKEAVSKTVCTDRFNLCVCAVVMGLNQVMEADATQLIWTVDTVVGVVLVRIFGLGKLGS